MARDVTVLDVRKLVDFADFFVICTGINERHIRGMVEELGHTVSDRGLPRLGVEGTTEAKWVLLDLRDVIVHVFTEQARSFYDLEMLWGDAPKVDWEENGGAAGSRGGTADS